MTQTDENSNTVQKSAWLALAIISSLALVTMYGETMVLPAIPDFIKDFQISYNVSSWILSSYLIAGAVMTPIAGKLSDIYGKKKVLLVVMIVYCTGILGGGFADSFGTMILARIAQGVGISMFPIAFGIVRDIFPMQKLAIAQGIFTSTFFGGSVVGLVVGARIISSFGWHATFFSVFPIAILLAAVMAKLITVPKIQNNNSKHYLDVKGAIILSATIILFLTGVSYLQEINTGNYNSVFYFISAAVLVVIFSMEEKKAKHPLVDLVILKDKIFLSTNVIVMIVGVSTFMVYQTIPILIQSPKPLGFGGDAITTANVQLPFMIVSLVVSAASGFIVSKVGNFRLTAIGTIVCTIGFFTLLLFHGTELEIASALGVLSVGLSFAFVGGFNIILVSSPQKAEGIALGMAVLLMLVGQSLGPSVAGMFQQMYGQSIPGIPGEFPSAQSYIQIFTTAGILALVSVTLVVLLRKKIKPMTEYTSH
ncbi:Transporter, major facilitator family protein [Nitrosotalea sinensis]|uniref:Transporter, major facilitator family protein n=1 Tax=Nitrosotalea sinensis TaxID=1499975 RepID=A0A2H1EHI8_9ARCH|nr:MFS transporter [Candidatus Nitrosotalea sinensis]SHO45628.1 Transporter, major facilitator family protein [Candidatus Nitrosotalea sinensis]